MSPPVDLRPLEGGLKVLWERVKQAGELITRLREEKASLQNRVSELEDRSRALEHALAEQKELARALESRQASSDGGDHVFSDGDREALALKVKDLLARIEAYL